MLKLLKNSSLCYFLASIHESVRKYHVQTSAISGITPSALKSQLSFAAVIFNRNFLNSQLTNFNMKNILSLFTICLLPLLGISQNNTQTPSSTGPKAVITYKTLPKINIYLEEIKELTNADDFLTEQVVFEIRKTKSTKIKHVVTDNEFNKLSKELQQEAIKKSEVVAIIETLKK